MEYHQGIFFLFLVFISCFAYSCNGYQFLVGGRDGWVLHPSESYNHWAERLRFQVNDTLLFEYKQGSDSVLVVNKGDYDSCNMNNPIQSLTDGNSVFRFDRSGPFYFISGNKTSCENGQKLVIIVLAIRNRPVTPPNTPSPASGRSPSPSPHGGAPVPSRSSPSPSPAAQGPSTSPYPAAQGPSTSPSPASQGPSTSPSPASQGPSTSPSPAAQGPSNAPSPASQGPSTAPSSASQGPSATPSPAAQGPSANPGPPVAASPGNGAPGAARRPADANSPPRRSSAVPAFSPRTVFVSAVALFLSVGFGGIMRFV